MARGKVLALAGAAATAAAGIALEKAALGRKRKVDPMAAEAYGERRAERTRHVTLRDGARIFVEESGPKTATKGALFIHGSALRTDTWYHQLEGVGGFRSVFYDMRGHGLSERGTADFTITELTRDVEEIAAAVKLKEFVIVGHSVGGMTALQLGRERPELLGSTVKGLVLVNTTYGPVTDTLIGGSGIARVERMTRRPFDAIGGYHQRIERLRRILRPSDALFWTVALLGFGPKASARQIDFTYDMLAETPMDVIIELIQCYRDYDMTDHLAEVTVPVLVIGGSHDRLTMAHASDHLADHLPKAELHIFDKSGHMTMLERHEEFNVMLAEFLTNTLGKRRASK